MASIKQHYEVIFSALPIVMYLVKRFRWRDKILKILTAVL